MTENERNVFEAMRNAQRAALDYLTILRDYYEEHRKARAVHWLSRPLYLALGGGVDKNLPYPDMLERALDALQHAQRLSAEQAK